MRHCSFSFLNWQPSFNFNEKKRLAACSIIEVFFTVLIMVLLILFMKKGHAPASALIFISIVFILILAWLFTAKNCNPFENNISRKIFKIYFFIITVALVFLYAIDFEHYDYLHQRLSASVLNYTSDAKTSMSMIWQTYPVITLLVLILISVFLLYGLIIRWFKKISLSTYRGKGFSKFFIGFVFTIILGLGIFGRLNQYPLRWSDAFALNDDFKANLSLNPVQSFLSTLQFINSTYDIKKVKEYYP